MFDLFLRRPLNINRVIEVLSADDEKNLEYFILDYNHSNIVTNIDHILLLNIYTEFSPTLYHSQKSFKQIIIKS